jgi:hypothetical protein
MNSRKVSLAQDKVKGTGKWKINYLTPYFTRKTMGFSKKLQNHLLQYELEVTIHNFVRPHRGIKYQTPMMAAGITDHVWSIEELLYFSKDN